MEEHLFDDNHLEKEKPKSPLWIVLGLALIFLVILMVVPHYGVKLDPEPAKTKLTEGIIGSNVSFNANVERIGDISKVTDLNDQEIRKAAVKIASEACKEGAENYRVCQAKALYYFVRDQYSYVLDPENQEYIEDPKEFLSVGGGDCESGSLALAMMAKSIGIDAQLVLITGHAYVRINLPEALQKYRMGDWVYLDWTCKQCAFGEVPWKNLQPDAKYVVLE